MNKERVLFLVFHNRCHRVILGFHQFFHQLVIEVAADFTGSVENHGCFIPWGACRPVREGWGFRTSVAGKVDPGGGPRWNETLDLFLHYLQENGINGTYWVTNGLNIVIR